MGFLLEQTAFCKSTPQYVSVKSVRLPINRSKPLNTVKFIHTVLLTVLTVSFMVSVTATPVLVHACKGMIEAVCETDCCNDLAVPESCCDEIVSVTRLDCVMVKDANASIPPFFGVVYIVLHTLDVASATSHQVMADDRAWRNGPDDPTPPRLCVFLI